MSGVLDHIGIGVGDYEKSKAFYVKALAPLGIELMMEFGTAAGFGKNGKPDFWIGGRPAGDASPQPIGKVHTAFVAATREEVDAFYAAAIAAGGADNGKPGLRPQYHPGYYGAFVLDPDGHNVEAVHHGF